MSNGPGKLQGRWAVAGAAVLWLSSIVAQAIAFDIDVRADASAGGQFKFFFNIVSTALFAYFGSYLIRPRMALFIGVLIVAIALFVGQAVLKDRWSCQYYDRGHIVLGTEPLATARGYIEEKQLLTRPCLDLLSPFGGDATRIWPAAEVWMRYILLFLLYSLSWIGAALLILIAVAGAASRKPWP